MTRPGVPHGHDRGGSEQAARRSRAGWRIFGIALAVVVAVAGLVLVAVVLFFYAAFNDFGSNK